MSDDNIKVIVRCRPFNQREKNEGATDVVTVDTEGHSLTLLPPPVEATAGSSTEFRRVPRGFTFDGVYGGDSKNIDIFMESFRPLIQAVLIGMNATIFAYGQTGSGKTYTMSGDKDQPGCTPNAFQFLFDGISRAGSNTEYLVLASYIEIYNEDIRDLIGPGTGLRLRENKDGGVYVKGVSQHRVRTDADLLRLMDTGFASRSVASTLMNATSSRSHSIFMVRVECSEVIGSKETIRVGKLNLVDLAGSERQSKTGATGSTLVEAAKINLSLTALGNVISKLVDGSPHIPYRDSKLTRLLQDSLGGNSKTLMCANISPASTNYDETMSTLRYADRAKRIQNHARINEDPKDAQIRQMRDHIKVLEEKLRLAQAQGLKPSDLLDIGRNLFSALDSAGVGAGADAGAEDSDPHAAQAGTAGRRGRGVSRAARLRAEAQSGPSTDTEATDATEEPSEEIVFVEDADDASAAERQRLRLLEESRQAAIVRLRMHEESTSAAKMTINEMREQLEALKADIFRGKELKGAVREQEMALRDARVRLAERQDKEALLRGELARRQELQARQEQSYASLKDEQAAVDAQLATVDRDLAAAADEVRQLGVAHAGAIEDLRTQLRGLDRACSLKQLLVDAFVPPHEALRLERRAVWDDDARRWVVAGAGAGAGAAGEAAGAKELEGFLRSIRHTSCVYPSGHAWPVSTAGGAADPGDARHLRRNLLALEPDPPERVTVASGYGAEYEGDDPGGEYYGDHSGQMEYFYGGEAEE